MLALAYDPWREVHGRFFELGRMVKRIGRIVRIVRK